MGNILRIIFLISSFCYLLCKWIVPVKLIIVYQPLCCKGKSRLKDLQEISRYFKCRSHFLSLLESVPKVMERFSIMVTIQHCRIVKGFPQAVYKTTTRQYPVCSKSPYTNVFLLQKLTS